VIEGYLLAVERVQPVSLDVLKQSLEDEGVQFSEEGGVLLSVRVNGARTDITYEKIKSPIKAPGDFITGSDESVEMLRKAKAIYRISFEPAQPQASVAVFEALWCVRALMEQVAGALLDVTAFKLHDAHDVEEITELEFDIRDHINLHAVEATEGASPLWVHTHGMEKFGARDVEAFNLSEEDLPAAESFFHRLCTDLAFGQGPPPRALLQTGESEPFMLAPADEARTNLMGIPLETFEGHEGLFFTVVSAGGRHTVAELLKPYRERFEEEPPERTEEMGAQAKELLPAFKARFLRKGLMEPLTFVVRAPFEIHPEGEPEYENLWVEVLTWGDDALVGKLVDGAAKTTEWRKGAQVEVEQSQVNALAIQRDGEQLEDDDVRALLLAEKPM
jgi:hypothetical protein